MPQLAGQKIEEMADVQALRKRKIVLLCSVVGFVYLSLFSFVRFSENDLFLGSLNFFSASVLLINIVYLSRDKKPLYASIVLSVVLSIHGLLFLNSGDSITERLLWLFPIMAVLVLVNRFRVGLGFGLLFLSTTSYFVVSNTSTPLSIHSSEIRFLLSLGALAVLCTIHAFYSSKMLDFIQSLYKEGIEDLAYLDQLTGLANRWSFENWAVEKIQQQQNTDSITALVFLDIDNFKFINDSYGHDVGDRVLKHFARRLKNNVRNKDRKSNKHDYSIARFAGDEFVLLLYDVKTAKDLENILHRVCNLFSSGYQGTERINQLTISAGVALYPEDADSLPELTRCADKAMYAAKHSGKNQYRYYRNDHAKLLTSADGLASVTPIKKASGSCT
ncbi:GGDEF domain-containing protein [Vibrio sinaloensis]|uniref:GGDEF domain-containing protein n=1 Tax=Photobacterium sp. (strain ATCC 43367) TaxID=379097 RepID=UPI00205DC549|nr:GGDEF domain-containing protein [Vibrio sinaloensis]UPQ89563.1 diguanylate cyclase [Vibrio sinaloensis]